MQLSREELLESYRVMRTIRDFEERVHEEFSAGGIPGFVHLYSGEEASAAGICQHLGDKDAIASTHRGHGHCIAKGCDVRQMMLEIYGRGEGLCGGKGGSMHIADLSKGMMGANGIVGGGPPLICGAALTAKYKKTGGVAIAVVEDNGYAEATSSKWSVGGNQLDRAKGFGMPCVLVDGHDFFAVHDAAGEAIERARNGGGPSLMHVKLNRFFGHFEGDAMTYRAEGEVSKLREEKDSLKIFRQHVTEADLLAHDELDKVDQEVAKLIDDSVSESQSAPPPQPDKLATDVYVSY